MAHWSARYIGLPYQVGSFDCVTLVERVATEVFGRLIVLPKDRAGERAVEVSAQLHANLQTYATRAKAPAEGEPVLMVGRGYLDHVGIATAIAGEWWVLHAFIRARHVVLHRLRDLPQHGLTVEGHYRWID
jgi:hypothetical protein